MKKIVFLFVSIVLIVSGCSSNKENIEIILDIPLPQMKHKEINLCTYTDTLSSPGLLLLIDGDCSICISRVIDFENLIRRYPEITKKISPLIIIRTDTPYRFEYNIQQFEDNNFFPTPPIFIDEGEYFLTANTFIENREDLIIFDKDRRVKYLGNMPKKREDLDKFLKDLTKAISKLSD